MEKDLRGVRSKYQENRVFERVSGKIKKVRRWTLRDKKNLRQIFGMIVRNRKCQFEKRKKQQMLQKKDQG
jgi:hypothetical protein